MIDAAMWAEARRLHKLEGFSISAIARRLALNRRTVRKFLQRDSYPVRKKAMRRLGKLGPFLETIKRYLDEQPDLSAVQVFERLRRDHQVGCGLSTVRKAVREFRRHTAEAYLTLTHLPGESVQIDWAHYGWVEIGRAKRQVSAFVAVLPFSRLLYAELLLSQRMDAFLEAHVRLFRFLGGVTRRAVYDNCKTVVLQRSADGIRLHPRLIDFCAHYLLKPRPCPPRKPWHKGGVESGVRYLRESFMRGRPPVLNSEDLERERRDLACWLTEVANLRIHAITREKPRELFERVERAALLPLPGVPYDTAHIEPSVSANKFYRVLFDGNRYSVPHVHAHQTGLVLRATCAEIEICKDGRSIAHHRRSYGRGEDIRDPEHDRGLYEKKRRAQRDAVLGLLVAHLGPSAESYAIGLAQADVRASLHLRKILRLVDRYGAPSVRAAIDRALAHGAYGADYVENIVHQNRRSQELGPVFGAPIVRDIDLAEIRLPEPDLSAYDALFQGGPQQ
jgi:transposase